MITWKEKLHITTKNLPTDAAPSHLSGVEDGKVPQSSKHPDRGSVWEEAPELSYHSFPAVCTLKLKASANDPAQWPQNTFPNSRKSSDSLPQTPLNYTSWHSHSWCWRGSTGRVSRLLSVGQSYQEAPLEKLNGNKRRLWKDMKSTQGWAVSLAF